MLHQLAGLSAGIGKAQPIDHIIQPSLQQYQEILAGNTRLFLGIKESLPELPFQCSVRITGFLLLMQLQGAVRESPPSPSGLLPRWFWSLVNSTLWRKTAAALQQELFTTAPT